jgi:hypothetical protein
VENFPVASPEQSPMRAGARLHHLNALMGWPDSYFNSDNALPRADLQKAQSLYEKVRAMKKEDRLKWMRKNKGGDVIIDYVRNRVMKFVWNYEAKAKQRSRR